MSESSLSYATEIQDETLRAMLRGRAARDLPVSRHEDKRTLVIRLARALRSWASLTAIGRFRFAEAVGVRGFVSSYTL